MEIAIGIMLFLNLLNSLIFIGMFISGFIKSYKVKKNFKKFMKGGKEK